MVGLMSDDSERIWKEALMAIRWNLPGVRKTTKTSVRIAGPLAEIQTEHL
jgi:hypothetical protein